MLAAAAVLQGRTVLAQLLGQHRVHLQVTRFMALRSDHPVARGLLLLLLRGCCDSLRRPGHAGAALSPGKPRQRGLHEPCRPGKALSLPGAPAQANRWVATHALCWLPQHSRRASFSLSCLPPLTASR